jgi:hypothetical protein
MMVSTKETASILGCTRRNVIRMVHAGQLKPVNEHKAFYLFDRDEVLTFKLGRDGKEKINL